MSVAWQRNLPHFPWFATPGHSQASNPWRGHRTNPLPRASAVASCKASNHSSAFSVGDLR